jgi:hypothetical protein
MAARSAVDAVDEALKANRREDHKPPSINQPQKAKKAARPRREDHKPPPIQQQQQQQQQPRKTARPPKPIRQAKADDALAIFNEVVKTSEGAPPTEGGESQHLKLSELEIVAAINNITGKGLPPEERLSIFQNEIWPRIRAIQVKERRYLPPHIYVVLTGFLGKLVDELACGRGLAGGRALALSKIFDSLSKPDLRIKSGLVASLCLNLAEEPDPILRDRWVKDIINMWKAISQTKRPSQRGRDLKFSLPSVESLLSLINSGLDATVTADSETPRWATETVALGALFNQFYTGHGRYAIPGLLTTLAAFADPDIKPKMLIEAAPLLELSRVALSRCNVDDAYIDRVFNAEDVRFQRQRLPQLRDMVKSRWPLVRELLNNEKAVWRRGLTVQPDKSSARTKSVAHFHKLLRAAHATNNTGVILSVWRDLRASMRKSQDLVAEMRSEPEFMDFWHFVWCASKMPAKLEEAQKVMQQVGLQQTIKTFTAMMHGWKLARDGDKMDAMWDSLRSSNVQLDAHAWTERISGLIELGKLQKGIDTLAEMLRAWQEANLRNQPWTAVQPTIEVVNAAFKPLLRLDKKAAYDVLAWAGREGINPDIKTYNILLSEVFRNKQPYEDVHNLLRAMSDQGLQPDGATFTIILEEALGALAHATAQEQVAAVDHIMEDIKSAGISPNYETYGKMLHAVASLPNGADETVEAVLRHMRSTGHKDLSPHILLILINRALDRGQANSDTIHNLLERHGYTSIHTGDQPLWEQVIGAYAYLGDTARAVGLYDTLRRESRPLTRASSLRDLLIALIEKDDMATARRVVGNALEDLKGDDPTERRWKHHFWHQAYKYGLLDWGKAPLYLRRVVDEARYVRETM